MTALYEEQLNRLKFDVELQKMSDEDILSFYERALFKQNAQDVRSGLLIRQIEEQLEKRLIAKGKDWQFLIPGKKGSSMLTPMGAKKMIDFYKSKHPELRNTDISVTKLEEFNSHDFSAGIAKGEGVNFFLGQKPGQNHFSTISVDHKNKYVYLTDSTDSNEYLKGWSNKQLNDAGYTFIQTAASRQSDDFACSVFCIRDISIFSQDPKVLEAISKAAKKTDPIAADLYRLEVVPADLMVSTQSMKKLTMIDDVRLFMEEGKSAGKSSKEIKDSFWKKYLEKDNEVMEELAKIRKIQESRQLELEEMKKLLDLLEERKKVGVQYDFYNGYFRAMDALLDDPELFEMYFKVKIQQHHVDTPQIATPKEAVQDLFPDGPNKSIQVNRSEILANIYREALLDP